MQDRSVIEILTSGIVWSVLVTYRIQLIFKVKRPMTTAIGITNHARLK